MSPVPRRPRRAAKRAAPKRAATKRVARRAAPKRAVKRAAPKRATAKRAATTKAVKRAASRTTPKRAAKRSAPKLAATKPASKRSPGRAAKRPAPKRPALRVVRRPAPRPAPPPAFPQAQDGSSRQKLLFELVRARATFMAAIHGLPAAAAERPVAPGRWSVREIALHLVARDRARLDELEGARLGRRGSWIGLDPAASARMNERDLAALRHHGWEDALRLLQITRQHLLEAVESVPEEPAEVWTPAHPFGEMLHLLPVHDRWHAAQVKAARLAPR